MFFLIGRVKSSSKLNALLGKLISILHIVFLREGNINGLFELRGREWE